jgi:hypothetical protein
LGMRCGGRFLSWVGTTPLSSVFAVPTVVGMT